MAVRVLCGYCGGRSKSTLLIVFDSAHDEIFSRSPSPPPKPSPKPTPSEKDETNHKNFVPIPWRVIGGGVLVSTAKKDGNEGDKFVPSIDCSLPSKPASFSLPPLKINTRQRSNSIPTTPSITQVNVEHVSPLCIYRFYVHVADP